MDVVDKLTQQILGQGITGQWTGEGFGSPQANARAMAQTLASAGINDINQFGVRTVQREYRFDLDEMSPTYTVNENEYYNKATGQPIVSDYIKSGGLNAPSGVLPEVFAGTYSGEGRTNFGARFLDDGTPVFYTQDGGDTSSMKDILSVLQIALIAFPGIGGAIGSLLTQTAATTIASQVVGGAIVSGLMSEASGGEFLDGAIRGAVTAGVAPEIASNVGQTVADVVSDSAIKDVIVNAVSSSASSAVTAWLTNGDVGQAAITGALAGAGGSVGRELGVAGEYGTDPFSEQTQMLASQEQGLGGVGTTGSSLGQALGAIGAGANPMQSFVNALSRINRESSAATPTSGFVGPVGPVSQSEGQTLLTDTGPQSLLSPLPGAEIAPPAASQAAPEAAGAVDKPVDTAVEITTPSTQEKVIPDQISQELGGVQEGVATTIPTQDQQVIDLITQPTEDAAITQTEPAAPGVQEGIATTIPEDLGVQGGIVDTIPEDLGVQGGVVQTEPEDLGLQGGIVETIPEDLGVQGGIVETLPEDLGVQGGIVETLPEDLGVQGGIVETLPEDLGVQGGIVDGLPEDITGIQEGMAETIPEPEAITTEPTPYIRDTYITGGSRKPPTFGPTVTTLGQALAAPLFPSAPVSGLTSYRGAGEIEGQKTGKPRQNVWNEASLRLKDALGL
jgi:hypothetical protein